MEKLHFKNNNLQNKNNNILFSLIKNQRLNIPFDKKLSYTDLKRISKYLDSSLFNNNECVLWSGYITTIKHDETKSYINFYYNGKKFALHRLLYINYIGDLHDSEYIKFNCVNKGKCCNIKHFYKIQHDKDKDEHINSNNKDKDEHINSNNNDHNFIEINNIKKKDTIIVDFD
jgi:hypothetical protein